jgi:hypothetical protein
MNCRDCTAFLIGYFEKDLPPETHAAFEKHLKACGNCLRYLETYRETIVLERGAFECKEALPTMPEELVQAILKAKKTFAK